MEKEIEINEDIEKDLEILRFILITYIQQENEVEYLNNLVNENLNKK
jgi:hypothetical protein